MTLVYADGVIVDGPPVADSDEELLEQLQFLASRSGVTGRPFSPADPQLDLRLHGGHRLAASAWTTPRPSVVIRRHRHVDIDVAGLVALGLLDAGCAEFLAACVRARKSMVVAGEQGAGKTTLLRALCNEIDPDESVGTIEYELHLDRMPDRHPRVFAWEARPGNGQVGPGGAVAGEISVAHLLYNAHRYNLSRVIVGEVRGAEVTTMGISAAQSAQGRYRPGRNRPRPCRSGRPGCCADVTTFGHQRPTGWPPTRPSSRWSSPGELRTCRRAPMPPPWRPAPPRRLPGGTRRRRWQRRRRPGSA